MYHGKQHRIASPVVYDNKIETNRREGKLIEDALRHALSRGGEFSVRYQPIVDAQTGKMVKAEALARWTSEIIGRVPPEKFIAVAEKSGLIIDVGQQIFNLICDDLIRTPRLCVSINFSPLQLQAPTFIPEVIDAFYSRNIATERIEIELTESVIVDDPELSAFRLDLLNEAGFSTALDDFGTGYSSLGYLRQMPFQTLKIDSSFVTRLEKDDPNRDLIRAITVLGHSLGQSVIAEGVETPNQANVTARNRLRSDARATCMIVPWSAFWSTAGSTVTCATSGAAKADAKAVAAVTHLLVRPARCSARLTRPGRRPQTRDRAWPIESLKPPAGSTHLARIQVVEAENLAALAGAGNAILGFIEQLISVDVKGVEPMVSVTPMRLKRRGRSGDRSRSSVDGFVQRSGRTRRIFAEAQGSGMSDLPNQTIAQARDRLRGGDLGAPDQRPRPISWPRSRRRAGLNAFVHHTPMARASGGGCGSRAVGGWRSAGHVWHSTGDQRLVFTRGGARQAASRSLEGFRPEYGIEP